MRAWSGAVPRRAVASRVGCAGAGRPCAVAVRQAVRGMARAAAVRLESVLFYFLKHSFPDLS